MSVISYPIPPYANLPINAQYYVPSQFVITAISLGATTTITTAVNNNYVIGQLVRLLIPQGFGSTQLNQQEAYVVGIPNPNQVTLQLNSSLGVDPFIANSAPTQAQIISVGDINQGVVNNSGLYNQQTFIPGSYINISPL
jgi:hypothetical protein